MIQYISKQWKQWRITRQERRRIDQENAAIYHAYRVAMEQEHGSQSYATGSDFAYMVDYSSCSGDNTCH